jgi:hypothetical protein
MTPAPDFGAEAMVSCVRVGLLVVLFLAAGGRGTATEVYVAPAGSDDNPGTLERPFATVQRAQKAAAPGDTVLIRGGTYKPTEAQIALTQGIFARVTVLDKSGEPGKPITYRAYQDEKPVFDCSAVKPVGKRVTAVYVSGSWLHLIGLDVTGVQVTIKTHTQSICFESQGSNNVFERLSMHDGQAIGIYHVRGRDNLFLNCDAWNNHDYTSEDGRGGNVDGFGCHPTRGSTGNVFRGCRAWFNSDDGYDCINALEPVVFENCWAMYNGLSPKKERLADGNGFKAGGYGSRPASQVPNPVPRHVVRFCVAVGNKASGIYANHHPGGIDFINNTASKNGTDFNMLGRLTDNRTDVDGYGHKLINNLCYPPRREVARMNAAKCELAGNSFTLGLKLSDKEFVSLDETELLKPRRPDGGLPEVGFLRPAPGSPLVRAGADNGLAAGGKQPDIGAFGPRP